VENNNIYIARLLVKYQQGTLSSTEREELERLLSKSQYEKICAAYKEERVRNEELLYYFESKKQAAWKKIQPAAAPPIKKMAADWKNTLKIAATILFVLGLSLWVFKTKEQRVFYNEVFPDKIYGQQNDVGPGSNQTLIKMADGQEINIRQDLLEITNDSIFAGEEKSFATALSAIRTIQTPKAANIEILLPDQSRVWLNASSELALDRKFNGSNRLVHLTGEAYFQVAHNDRKKFQVVNDHDTVTVYGTAFNVNCYDKKFQTTLVEGKVGVDDSQGNHLSLIPGYQSVKTKGGGLVSKKVEVLKYTSWKDGYFYFNRDNLAHVLSKLEQWYDIEIQPETDIKTITVSGSIGKNASLAEAASILSDVSKLKFTIHNRTLTISK
jgi:ferric-dicitrate binding protein FerR (iron transport regulator)